MHVQQPPPPPTLTPSVLHSRHLPFSPLVKGFSQYLQMSSCYENTMQISIQHFVRVHLQYVTWITNLIYIRNQILYELLKTAKCFLPRNTKHGKLFILHNNVQISLEHVLGSAAVCVCVCVHAWRHNSIHFRSVKHQSFTFTVQNIFLPLL